MMALSLFENFADFDPRPEPAIGYRVWRVTGNRLRSLTAPSVWEPGVKKVAICGGDEPSRALAGEFFRLPRRGHRSPEPRCQCGIYAHHRLSDALRQASLGPRYCAGAVCSWGRLVIHKEGFRAEFAALIGLCVPPVHLAFKNPSQPLEAIARDYRVPIFLDPERLVIFASEFGASYAPATG